MPAGGIPKASHLQIEEGTSEIPFERAKFLWNQQRYLLENIKLSDTKAGFVMTFAGAVLSAAGTKLSPSLEHWNSGEQIARALLTGAGGICQIVAILLSAWSIKPRIRSDNRPSPVSWVNIAQYPDPISFREANKNLNEATSADYLADQVFYMARICVTKHRLVSKSILLALCGGSLLGVSLLIP